MKKILLPIICTLLVFQLQAQKLSRVNFTESGDVETLGFETDEGVMINLSKDGAISKFGVDIYKGYRENTQNVLQDYVGRIEYYTENDNEAFRGKVKSIGRTPITYYASFDNEALVGKVKTIGRLAFNYYFFTENDAFKGKIQSAGSTNFTYYNSYDNEAFRGKFKTIGNTALTYNSSLEDAGIKGKVKSIGSYNYTYYPSQYFRAELRGRLKSGNMVQQEGSVKYFLKY